MMKIVIPGGSGQVGNFLARAFQNDGHETVVLSRNPDDHPLRSVRWDGVTLGDWVSELDGADIVINLAGRSVNCRYNKKNQKEIMESRVNSTRIIGEAINQVENPPHTWLQASTATIYSHRYDAPNDEISGIIGGNEIDTPKKWRYSTDVAKSWEKTLDDAIVPKTRKITLRSALTLSPDREGIFDTLLRLVRFGLGGRAGSGEQYVSWIHDTDFVNSINWLIEHEEFEGVVNIASPNPLPFSQFMKEMRAAWGRRIGLPATKWMLEIGAFFMRTETELILKSRRVIPGRLLKEGFTFEYPLWENAVQDLINRWKTMNQS